jgi:hypothetical protein
MENISILSPPACLYIMQREWNWDGNRELHLYTTGLFNRTVGLASSCGAVGARDGEGQKNEGEIFFRCI